jgi:hypothetical protein
MYADFFKCLFRGFGNEAGVSPAEYVCPFRLPKSDTPHRAGKTKLVKDDWRNLFAQSMGEYYIW